MSDAPRGTPAPRSPEERRRVGGRAAPPDAWGVVPAFEDAFGHWREVPDEVRARLRAAMGAGSGAEAPPTTDDAVTVVEPGTAPRVGPGELRLEDGTAVDVGAHLPDDLPAGYHDLHREDRENPTRVIVSPGACHRPERLGLWGLATQVYALHSAGSWGVGDLADLRALGEWSSARGAGVMLVNPLDAVAAATPRETSPYFPTTRRFRDPLYLRVAEVPGAELAAELLPRAAAGARGAGGLIDRDAAHRAKLGALEAIFERSAGAGHDPAFERFRAEQGLSLRRFATFCVLAERHGGSWRAWPAPLRRPDTRAVAEVAAAEPERVRFHMWVQWLCDEQLRAAGRGTPLMRDLPIGFDPDGFDAWEWQDLLADGVTVGAPPDELGPRGQDWRLPAFVPWKLRAVGYEPIVATLRSAFRHAGALRIDHVLGLFRLYWIPPGGDATTGAYVRQPARELLAVLALESQRAGAYVVGEDLGTVEEGVRDELHRRGMLRYQVWWFEDDPIGSWTPDALASVTTHDLPTVAGVWSGRDADEQAELGLRPDTVWHADLRRRIREVTGLGPGAAAGDVVVALHDHLARGPSAVVLAQLDDALAATRRPNVPGTDREERPANWSLPLPAGVDEFDDHPVVSRLVGTLARARPRRASR